jgi:hypothetical protein
MVSASRAKVSTALRWAQITHSIILVPLLIIAAVSDSYIVILETGQSIDIAAYYWFLGDMLVWTLVLVIAAQALSIWRLSTVSIWIYAWFGTWLALFSLLIATSGEFLTKQVRNLSALGQWFINLFEVEYDIALATIEVGNAWIFLLIASTSMIAMSIWLFIEKYRHSRQTQPK